MVKFKCKYPFKSIYSHKILLHYPIQIPYFSSPSSFCILSFWIPFNIPQSSIAHENNHKYSALHHSNMLLTSLPLKCRLPISTSLLTFFTASQRKGVMLSLYIQSEKMLKLRVGRERGVELSRKRLRVWEKMDDMSLMLMEFIEDSWWKQRDYRDGLEEMERRYSLYVGWFMVWLCDWNYGVIFYEILND